MVFYFEASDGSLIFMGRDKVENEELLTCALPTDVWLHVDNLSSAHVYLRLSDELRRRIFGRESYETEEEEEEEKEKKEGSDKAKGDGKKKNVTAAATVTDDDDDDDDGKSEKERREERARQRNLIEEAAAAERAKQRAEREHHAFEELLYECAQLVKANSIEGNKKNQVPIVYTLVKNLKKTKRMEVGQVSFHSPNGVRKTVIEKRENAVVNRLNRTRQEAATVARLREDKASHEAAVRAIERDRKRRADERQRAAQRLAQDRAKQRQYKGVMDQSAAMTSNDDIRRAMEEQGKTVEDIEDDFF